MDSLHSDNHLPPTPTCTYAPVLPSKLKIKHGGDKPGNSLNQGPNCSSTGSPWFFKVTNDCPLDFRLNVTRFFHLRGSFIPPGNPGSTRASVNVLTHPSPLRRAASAPTAASLRAGRRWGRLSSQNHVEEHQNWAPAQPRMKWKRTVIKAGKEITVALTH